MPQNNKPCHNCRRRRLRCDRSWPTCNKCTITGQECLGYGKVYVWTEGIDAQGKVKPSPGVRRAAYGENHGVAGHPSLVLHSGPPPLPPTAVGTVQDSQHPGGTSKSPQNPADTAMPTLPQCSAQQKIGGHAAYLVPSQLTDPVFQDLDPTSRIYLAHCELLSSAYFSTNTNNNTNSCQQSLPGSSCSRRTWNQPFSRAHPTYSETSFAAEYNHCYISSALGQQPQSKITTLSCYI